jgi:hypothetical protein
VLLAESGRKGKLTRRILPDRGAQRNADSGTCPVYGQCAFDLHQKTGFFVIGKAKKHERKGFFSIPSF